MKANELMVGDWVISVKRGREEVLSVVSIDGGTNICWLDADEYSGCVHCDYIAGLQLLPELLEKNGFSFSPFGRGFWSRKTEDGEISCTKTKDGYWVVYVNDNIIPAHIHFVHELQNIARMCQIGIDFRPQSTDL